MRPSDIIYPLIGFVGSCWLYGKTQSVTMALGVILVALVLAHSLLNLRQPTFMNLVAAFAVALMSGSIFWAVATLVILETLCRNRFGK